MRPSHRPCPPQSGHGHAWVTLAQAGPVHPRSHVHIRVARLQLPRPEHSTLRRMDGHGNCIVAPWTLMPAWRATSMTISAGPTISATGRNGGSMSTADAALRGGGGALQSRFDSQGPTSARWSRSLPGFARIQNTPLLPCQRQLCSRTSSRVRRARPSWGSLG